MAKKTGKSRKSAPKPVKSARKAKSRRTSGGKVGSKVRGAKQPGLPGTEGARFSDLDEFCESYGSEARTMNAARKEMADLKTRAGASMQKKDKPVQVYKHAGVVFSVTPGAMKVSARLVDDEGDASVVGGTTATDAPAS